MKGIRFLFLLFFLFGAVSGAFAEYVMRVNCNGADYVDTQGHFWRADPLNYNGNDWQRIGGWEYVYSYDVANTRDDPLYQKSFYALDWYHFPVPNGQYQVTLKFAEPFYSKPNERIFDIRIEGNKVINHLDPPAVYGKGRAFDKTFTTNVSDGKLSIQFIHVERPDSGFYAHAFINAIEILEVGSSLATLELSKDKISINVSSKFATLALKNSGDEPLTWTISEAPDVPWISRITPVSGTIMKDQSEDIFIYINREGLTTGDYDTHLHLTTNAGDRDIPVVLHVEENTPFLTVRPEQLLFSGPVSTRVFRIENAGTANGDWSAAISDGETWITAISPDTGTVVMGTEDSVAVSIDPESLEPGINRGIVTITTPRGQQKVDIVAFQQQDTLRINCGGEDYLDSHDHYWLSDFCYSGGTADFLYEEIENSTDDELFQRARVGESHYHIPVQYDGLYQIIMHFAEVRYRAPDFRIFDVMVENELVIENLDAHKEAGFGYPVTRGVQTVVRDKQLDFDFIARLREPRICAIEIVLLSRFPEITSLNQIAVNEDELLKYQIQATDPDGPPPHISTSGLASWLTFANSEITGVPVEGITDTTFLIIASDGILADSLTVQVDVIPVNDPPKLTSPTTVTAREDSIFEYTATAVDPDSPELSFVFQQLPVWLAAEHNLASGTPPEGALDTRFTLIVSDGELADTAIVHIEIEGDNDPPQFVSPHMVTAVEDELFSYTPAADDPDGDPIAFTFENLPCWLMADENSVTGRPGEGIGDTLFTVLASDGFLSDTLVVQVQVQAVNDPPKITSPFVANAIEDIFFEYVPMALDPDNSDLSFIFANYPVWLTSEDGILHGTPREGAADSSFSLTVSDGELSDTVRVQLTVTPVNDPPHITSPAAVIAVEDIIFNYPATATDPENDVVSFIFMNYPNWMTPAEAVISGTPLEGAADTSFLTIATDGQLFDTLQVMVELNGVNDPPVITSPTAVQAIEDELFSYFPIGQDPEGDVLHFAMENGPVWLTATDTLISGTPLEGDIDTSFVLIMDDGDLADTLMVQVWVTPVNDPPKITSPAVVDAREDEPFSYTASCDDPEGDEIQIWFEHIPGWLAAENGTLTGTPGENTTDTSFTILASDGELNDTLQVLLRVGAVNDPPQLSLPELFEFRVDSIVTFYLPDVVSDPDDPLENLTWSVSLDPENNILFSVDTSLTATISALAPDSTVATVTVTDPGGLSDEARITIIVRGNTGILPSHGGKIMGYALAQNYPNPFNPETHIQFSLPEQTRISLQVFDATGRRVAELVNQVKPAGNHAITWNAAAQSSGIYYILLKTPEFTQMRKCILLK